MHPPYWPILEPAWKSINSHVAAAPLAASLALWPNHIQHLFAAKWFECELQNGGLYQFFWNMPCLALHSVNALRAIELPAAAETLSEATELVGGPFDDVPTARARLDTIDYDDRRLHALELRIGESFTDPRDDSDRFESAMISYAQRHFSAS